MPGNKLNVMIGSTSFDSPEHRKEVMEAIQPALVLLKPYSMRLQSSAKGVTLAVVLLHA